MIVHDGEIQSDYKNQAFVDQGKSPWKTWISSVVGMGRIWLDREEEEKKLSAENSVSTAQKCRGVWTALGMTAGEQVEALCRGMAGKMAARSSYAVTVCQALLTAPGKH